MGMLDWPDPHSGSRSRRGREHRDEPIEEYEPDEMPVREGYWSSYGREVGLCAVSVAVTAFIFFSMSDPLSVNGFRGLLYLSLFLIFGIVPAILPFVWYDNHRRLRALYQSALNDLDTTDDGERRQLGDDS